MAHAIRVVCLEFTSWIFNKSKDVDKTALKFIKCFPNRHDVTSWVMMSLGNLISVKGTLQKKKNNMMKSDLEYITY